MRSKLENMDTEPTAMMVYAIVALVQEGDIIELMNYPHAMKMRQHMEWQMAVDSENQSLKKNEVYEITDKTKVPPGRRVLTGRYVFKLKTLYDSMKDEYYNKYKVRLVARGF